MDLEAIQKAVSGAITAAISRAVRTPLLTDAASTSGQQSSTATSRGNDEQTVERKYVYPYSYTCNHDNIAIARASKPNKASGYYYSRLVLC